MAITHRVTLTHSLSGAEIDVWDGYMVVQDMFDAGNPWTFTLWRSAKDDTPGRSRRRLVAWRTINDEVMLDDEITLSIDGAPQMVGIVERMRIGAHPKGGAAMVLSGRDLAGPLITGDADPITSIANRQLGDVLADLFAPYRIPVIIGHSPDAAREVQTRQRPGSRGATSRRPRQRIDRTHPKPGEKTWQIAEDLVKQVGLLMYVAPVQGQLAVVVTTPNYAQEPLFTFWRTTHNGVVSQDSNILSSDFDVQTQTVPSVVNVYTRTPREDSPTPARIAEQIVNDRLDPDRVRSPHRVRPVHMLATRARNAARARQEGMRHLNEAMLHHRTYSLVTQAHGQFVRANEQHPTLFGVNIMAGVIDQEISRINEAMLIQRVTFKGSHDEAQITEVVLGTRDAIRLIPEDET